LTPAQAYDRIAANYDGLYGDRASIAEDYVVYRRLLKGWGRRGMLMDLGCGPGTILDHLDIHQDHYVGVDVSNEMLAKARVKHPFHRFSHGDMGNLAHLTTVLGYNRYADEVVSLYGSASYVKNPTMFIHNLDRIMRPGSRFMIMLYSGASFDRKKTYCLKRFLDHNEDLPWRWMPSAYMVEVMFNSIFDNVQVKGLSLPWIPRLPQALANQWRHLEFNTVGRCWPDQCYFLVVTGEKLL